MSGRWSGLGAVVLVLFGSLRVAEAQANFSSRGTSQSTVATGSLPQPLPTPNGSPTAPPTPRIRFEPAPDVNHPRPVRRGIRPFEPFVLWPFNQVISPLVPVVAPTLQPETGLLGGIQLDVQPWRAQVYADGAYVGLVEDFSGYYHHLELAAGPHVITIVAPDREPLIIEVMVSPGRTITHRATLNRAPGR